MTDGTDMRSQRDTAIRLLREHAWGEAEVFRFLETVAHVDSPESSPFPDPPKDPPLLTLVVCGEGMA